MKIYLAAAFSRQTEMRAKAIVLEKLGQKVVSRWIDHDDNPVIAHWADPETTARFAMEDVEDLNEAGMMICFTEPHVSKTGNRGAPHVAFGWALANGRRLVVIGSRENHFHYLPKVEYFEEWGQCYWAKPWLYSHEEVKAIELSYRSEVQP